MRQLGWLINTEWVSHSLKHLCRTASNHASKQTNAGGDTCSSQQHYLRCTGAPYLPDTFILMVILNKFDKIPTKRSPARLPSRAPHFVTCSLSILWLWSCQNLHWLPRGKKHNQDLAVSTLKAIKCSDERWWRSHSWRRSVLSSSQFPCCHGHLSARQSAL